MAKDNKTSVTTSYGDRGDSTQKAAQNDNPLDFKQDTAGFVPGAGVNNFFPVSGTFGDRGDATQAAAQNDNVNDFGQDSAGVPNVNQGEQTDLDMALEPNKFPRETGHDTMTDEELSYI